MRNCTFLSQIIEIENKYIEVSNEKVKGFSKHSQTLETVWATTKPVVFYLNFPTTFLRSHSFKSSKTLPIFLTLFIFRILDLYINLNSKEIRNKYIYLFQISSCLVSFVKERPHNEHTLHVTQG